MPEVFRTGNELPYYEPCLPGNGQYVRFWKYMFAIILKELRCYTNSAKYRRIQMLVLCGFALLLLIGTVEFYAHQTIGVGQQAYKLCMIFLFVVQLWVVRHAVEAWHAERQSSGHGINGVLLALAPLTKLENFGR